MTVRGFSPAAVPEADILVDLVLKHCFSNTRIGIHQKTAQQGFVMYGYPATWGSDRREH
jgi:hypothetical protein